MTLYTGYFEKAPSYAENDLVVCSIAQYNPSWFTGLSLTRREQEIPHLYRWWDELR